MPRVLLYEFVSSGGMWTQGESPPSESLRREGLAMLAALAADFAALDQVETSVLVDARWSELNLSGCRTLPVRSADEDRELLAESSRQADWTIVIAPEFDRLLEDRCRMIEQSGGRVLGPSADLVALAADKQRMAEYLAAAGVAVPFGAATEPAEPLPLDFPYPAVFKPRFGAGSQDVWMIPDRAVAEQIRGGIASAGRLERFCPGQAASVAFLCGPAGCFALPACRQRLTADGRFRYLGGECPLEPDLNARATALAARAVAALPDPLGYLGVDLVLGEAPDGRDDMVIEVNPRLTTSYVGLRAIGENNLAHAMLEVAAGGPPCLSWSDRRVEFDFDGSVRTT